MFHVEFIGVADHRPVRERSCAEACPIPAISTARRPNEPNQRCTTANLLELREGGTLLSAESRSVTIPKHYPKRRAIGTPKNACRLSMCFDTARTSRVDSGIWPM